ncbi:hypothetical protein FOL47_010491 [Perkinsus chesapeaki]|uniref:Uncharacterized protein n=1 Tax=Perkinsus chesapeaki TaxID=330153 RepID=A0A7J6L2X7_PERCH|nr:hypothetical protein FOL47_010491 [Perkinsus chesapeaki]
MSMADISDHLQSSAGKVWDEYVTPSHQMLLETAGYPSPVPEIVTAVVLLVSLFLTKRLLWGGRKRAREGADCLLRYVQSRGAQQVGTTALGGQQQQPLQSGMESEQVRSIMEQKAALYGAQYPPSLFRGDANRPSGRWYGCLSSSRKCLPMASHQNDVIQNLISETQNQFSQLESGVSQLKAERDEADYELLTSSQQAASFGVCRGCVEYFMNHFMMIEHLAAKKLPQLDEETRATLPRLDDTPIDGYDLSVSEKKGLDDSFIKLPEGSSVAVDASSTDGMMGDVSSSEFTSDLRGRVGSSAAATVGSSAVMSDLAAFAPVKESSPVDDVTAPQNYSPIEEVSRVPLGYSTDSGMASSNEASDNQAPRPSHPSSTLHAPERSQVPASPVPSPSLAPSQVHSVYSYGMGATPSEVHSAVSTPQEQAAPMEQLRAMPVGPVAPPRPAGSPHSNEVPPSSSPASTGHPAAAAAFGHPTRARRAMPAHHRAKPKQILGTTDPFATPIHHGGVSSPSASSTTGAAAGGGGAGLTTGAGSHTYISGFPTK